MKKKGLKERGRPRVRIPTSPNPFLKKKSVYGKERNLPLANSKEVRVDKGGNVVPALISNPDESIGLFIKKFTNKIFRKMAQSSEWGLIVNLLKEAGNGIEPLTTLVYIAAAIIIVYGVYRLITRGKESE